MSEQRVGKKMLYIVSVRHTQRGDQFITFWRPNNAGYAYPLSWAGKYDSDEILQGYHNNGWDTIAVSCDVVDALAEPTPRGWIDNDAGPIVYHNRANWKVLLANVIVPPVHTPKPQYPRRRRVA